MCVVGEGRALPPGRSISHLGGGHARRWQGLLSCRPPTEQPTLPPHPFSLAPNLLPRSPDGSYSNLGHGGSPLKSNQLENLLSRKIHMHINLWVPLRYPSEAPGTKHSPCL